MMNTDDKKNDPSGIESGSDPMDIETSTQLTIDEFEEEKEKEEEMPEAVDTVEEKVEESVLMINPDKNSMESRG